LILFGTGWLKAGKELIPRLRGILLEPSRTTNWEHMGDYKTVSQQF